MNKAQATARDIIARNAKPVEVWAVHVRRLSDGQVRTMRVAHAILTETLDGLQACGWQVRSINPA